MKITRPIEKEKYGVFQVEQLTRDTKLEELVAVDLVVLNKNQKSSVHRHNFSETVLYFTEGSGEVSVDDQIFQVQAGERLSIPAKAFHGVTTKDQALKFISIQTPPILNKRTNVLDLEEKSLVK